MNEDKEVTVTVTPEDMEFRARAKAAGLPDTLISMYGTALRKLIAAEREQCAKVCEENGKAPDDHKAYEGYEEGYQDGSNNCAAAIRSRT